MLQTYITIYLIFQGNKMSIYIQFVSYLFWLHVLLDISWENINFKICLMRILYEKRYSTLGDIVR